MCSRVSAAESAQQLSSCVLSIMVNAEPLSCVCVQVQGHGAFLLLQNQFSGWFLKGSMSQLTSHRHRSYPRAIE